MSPPLFQPLTALLACRNLSTFPANLHSTPTAPPTSVLSARQHLLPFHLFPILPFLKPTLRQSTYISHQPNHPSYAIRPNISLSSAIPTISLSTINPRTSEKLLQRLSLDLHFPPTDIPQLPTHPGSRSTASLANSMSPVTLPNCTNNSADITSSAGEDDLLWYRHTRTHESPSIRQGSFDTMFPCILTMPADTVFHITTHTTTSPHCRICHHVAMSHHIIADAAALPHHRARYCVATSSCTPLCCHITVHAVALPHCCARHYVVASPCTLPLTAYQALAMIYMYGVR